MSIDQLDQQQLQEIRSELIVEQYRSLREEIIQRVQARQQMWYVLLFVAGTFFTIGIQPGFSAWTLPCFSRRTGRTMILELTRSPGIFSMKSSNHCIL